MSRPVKKEASALEIEIRRAQPDEAEAISRLIREAFGPFESEYTAEAFEYTTPSADAIRPRFDEGPIWVAFENGVMVGTVSGLTEPDRFYIRSMAIKPSAQRLGIGQRLLETLETFARGIGYNTLYLYTTFVLPGAKRAWPPENAPVSGSRRTQGRGRDAVNRTRNALDATADTDAGTWDARAGYAGFGAPLRRLCLPIPIRRPRPLRTGCACRQATCFRTTRTSLSGRITERKV